MAHYAYKEFCYDIDYEEFKKYVKKFEKEVGEECDGDSNYNGDHWRVAAMWVKDLLEENKLLKKRLRLRKK